MDIFRITNMMKYDDVDRDKMYRLSENLTIRLEKPKRNTIVNYNLS